MDLVCFFSEMRMCLCNIMHCAFIYVCSCVCVRAYARGHMDVKIGISEVNDDFPCGMRRYQYQACAGCKGASFGIML